MKICLGLRNIASLFSEYRKGFERLGHDVLAVDIGVPSRIVRRDADRQINNLIPKQVFENQMFGHRQNRKNYLYAQHYLEPVWKDALDTCDAFIFLWRTFRPDNSDLALLKQAGKKIGVIYCGSEVRYKHSYEQWCEVNGVEAIEYGLTNDLNEMTDKLHYLRMAEKYADFVSGGPMETALSLRPQTVYVGMLDTSVIPHRAQQRDVPKVVHAPSRRATKGTEHWLHALNELERDGVQFELELIEGRDFEEALKCYADADVYLGTLGIGGKGAREALAAGCVVVEAQPRDMQRRVLAGYRQGIDSINETPVVNVRVDTVVETLRSLLPDQQRRQCLAYRGRSYIEKFYDCAANCSVLIQALNGQCPNENIVRKSFFRDGYVPEDVPEKVAILNKYTKEVQRCAWYQEIVEPGVRAGLTF